MEINPQKYDSIARNIFRPIYPVIAEQIIAYTGISKGDCLDIGCGGGYLGLALARCSGLRIHFLDPLKEMLEIVRRNVSEERLEDRTAILHGSAEAIPLPDGAVDLAVSRGSVFFWDDLESAFQEIHRVLAPGGMAYIGGGFGSAKLKQEVIRKREAQKGDGDRWQENIRRNIGSNAPRKFRAALKRAAVPLNEIIHNQEVGLWITIAKAK
ncbi:MAG: methyltransferase domain-containing protein [Desulfarculaceae bacterium]|jgi:ubiquinone/menaquinone biosynthesis C-methylase UbiE